MAVEERDPYTGYMTTGHEWNGIKELNTPVPRPVYFFLAVTALFAVVSNAAFGPGASRPRASRTFRLIPD